MLISKKCFGLCLAFSLSFFTAMECNAGGLGIGRIGGGRKNRTSTSSSASTNANGELSIDQLKGYVEQIQGFKKMVDEITKGFPVTKELSEKDYMGALTAFGFNAKGDAKEIASGLLAVSAFDGNIASIKKYLSQNADLNFKSKTGVTPLLLSLFSQKGNKAEIVKLILENNADPDVKITTEELTPLMLIALLPNAGNKQIVKDLIDAKADINARSKHGMTPIILGAALGTNAEALSTMLNYGADKDAKTEAGLTAAAIAILNKNGDVKKLFVNAEDVAKDQTKKQANKKARGKLGF